MLASSTGVIMSMLCGDIGGTKTRIARCEAEGGAVRIVREEVYPSQEYDSLDRIVAQFLRDEPAPCAQACFGIAGPVHDKRSETTNLPWVVDANELESNLGIARVQLLNDLEANAWGISALQREDFFSLQEGAPEPTGNACIIAAGTGLGQAGLYWDGNRHVPFATEGGHTDFSPASDLEWSLYQHLSKQFGHVSWERVVSGMGIVNIHRFLNGLRGVRVPDWLAQEMREGDAAAAISKAAGDARCPVCEEVMALFGRLYGREAGNQALKLMATGGVYLGGGIAPKNLALFRRPAFLEAFIAKGRMEPLMRRMPVRIILNDRAALFGPAIYLAARP